MLTARHLAVGDRARAHDAMRVACALLLAITAIAAIGCAVARSRLGALFTGDGSHTGTSIGTGTGDSIGTSTEPSPVVAPSSSDRIQAADRIRAADLARGLGELAVYIPLVLLLRSSAGLFGQSLAVSGRGALGSAILFTSHWLVGLPAAWLWAASGSVSAVALALTQAHAAAWLVATTAFAAAYALAPTRTAPTAPSHETAAATLVQPPRVSPHKRGLGATPHTDPLARPLLEGGRPAR